jgi:hypothetical protein
LSTVLEMIREIESHGAEVTVTSEGKLRIKGPLKAKNFITPIIDQLRANREALIFALRSRQGGKDRPVPLGCPKQAELALKIKAHLRRLPGHVSATSTDIADALFGRKCTLIQIMEIDSICQELLNASVLVYGQNGYGYQLAR